MTTNEILKIAKKTSCKCCECGCTIKSTVGKPVFGNDAFECKIDSEGRTYCYSCANKLRNSITLVTIPEWTEADRISDRETVLSSIKEMNEWHKFTAYEKNEHITVRCMREDNTVFVYSHGKQRYGHRYNFSVFADMYDLKAEKATEVTESDKWHKRISRAIKCLEKSGLWADLLEKLKNLNSMDYDDREDLRLHYTWNGEGNKILIEKYESKYPFVVYVPNKDYPDIKAIDTFYLYETSNCILKSMYFGKYGNASEKQTIADRIASKEDYKTTARTGYDVSFSYDSKTGKAFYSEEYKGCGNGHYYIALDNSTALFCEDD